MSTTINGVMLESEEPKSVIALVLTIFKDLKYRSKDSLYEVYVGACEMAIEYARDEHCKGNRKAVMTRFINATNSKIKNINNKYDKMSRNDIIHIIYNEILSAGGDSPLIGFGFTNKHGDGLKGDPEKHLNKKEE